MRVTPIQFRVEQRRDVDAVDGESVDLAVNRDVDELDAAHGDALEGDIAERRVDESDGAKRRAGQVGLSKRRATQIHALEACVVQISLVELDHRPNVLVRPRSHQADCSAFAGGGDRVQLVNDVARQFERGAVDVLVQVHDRGRAGNEENVGGALQEPGEGDR